MQHHLVVLFVVRHDCPNESDVQIPRVPLEFHGPVFLHRPWLGVPGCFLAFDM